MSLKDLLADAPVLPPGHSLRGVSSLVRDGEVIAQWIKTSDTITEDTIAEITEAMKGHVPAQPLPRPSFSLKKLATVYLLSDWHIGLLAWGKEVGKDYDSTIAWTEISSAMARLFSLTPASDQAVVLGLGDIMHFDGYEHVTPQNKNRLDGDGRYPKGTEDHRQPLPTDDRPRPAETQAGIGPHPAGQP